MSLRCTLGLHDWSEIEKEPIKLSRFNILFTTYGTQEGTRGCYRCGKKQRLERSGMCGIGGSAGRWKKKR
jgi:hypothetical protein